MRINLLGPIEVKAAGPAVALAPKERALVAALALAGGHLVSNARLSRALWDSIPPASMPTKLHTYVSSVRRAIGQRTVSVGPLLTHSGGYQLSLRQDELDLAEFDSLIRAARKVTTAGRPDVASDHYGAALALWRGPACGAVNSYSIRAAAEALDQRRLMAVEARAEVDLDLGRTEAVVDDLATLLVSHPHREHMRALLMLALYRYGCRADAIAVFRSGRRLCSEELGLEPGPDLCRLHMAMLDGEADLLRRTAGDLCRMTVVEAHLN